MAMVRARREGRGFGKGRGIGGFNEAVPRGGKARGKGHVSLGLRTAVTADCVGCDGDRGFC